MINEIAQSMLYDHDPFSIFEIPNHISKLRNNSDHGKILQDLIQKHLLTPGGNMIKLRMEGDKEYIREGFRKESANTYNTFKYFETKDIQKIINDMMKFEKRRAMKDDLDNLPEIEIKDLVLTKELPKSIKGTLHNGIPIQKFIDNINGTIRLNILFDICTIPKELQLYIELCCLYNH